MTCRDDSGCRSGFRRRSALTGGGKVPARLEGKIALVTGGGSGIGRAIARTLAAEGAKAVVADVSTEGAERTVGMVEEAGGEAISVSCDVTDSTQVEAMIDRTVEVYGRLDCAVNNAGTEGVLAPVTDYPREVWDRVISLNLTAVWLCMKHEFAQMQRQGGGAIVNTASILGLVGFPTTPAYTASKHGVIGLTKVAALECAEQGIRVNAVCPGWIETPMVMERGVQAGANPEVYQQLAEAHPVKRLGKPEEIAEAVVWLCSDSASFVTGQAMVVDGGYVAQ